MIKVPTFELQCLDCEAIFMVPGINHRELDSVFCVDCRSKNIKRIDGFNSSDSESFYLLAKQFAEEIARLDDRLDEIEEVLKNLDVEFYNKKSENNKN